jgi:hypothetical protein
MTDREDRKAYEPRYRRASTPADFSMMHTRTPGLLVNHGASKKLESKATKPASKTKASTSNTKTTASKDQSKSKENGIEKNG